MILVFWGCGDRGALDVKTVKASRFTDLVFDGDALTPGQGFNWQMGTEDYLSKVYGADTMKPGSESFNEYRYFYSEEMGVSMYLYMAMHRPLRRRTETACFQTEGSLYSADSGREIDVPFPEAGCTDSSALLR